ncbi:MAG TPA: carboxypeptidase-like regulatory domain-containing protein [Candidatus Acidoferrum sp.]|nr:carboxypeptidase-like regulatory domain-containing protein [Candidatus Acidoferrum sp.]
MKYTRCLAGIFTLVLFFACAAAGQDSKKDKETQLRTVRGVVSDKADNPMPNSVVFLKNLRTNGVRSNFADSDGNYRFSGLDPNADYEIHAEFEGAKSPVRSVTSLDSRKEMVINLKIDRKKS